MTKTKQNATEANRAYNSWDILHACATTTTHANMKRESGQPLFSHDFENIHSDTLIGSDLSRWTAIPKLVSMTSQYTIIITILISYLVRLKVNQRILVHLRPVNNAIHQHWISLQIDITLWYLVIRIIPRNNFCSSITGLCGFMCNTRLKIFIKIYCRSFVKLIHHDEWSTIRNSTMTKIIKTL